MFGVVRCVRQNSELVSNIASTDQTHLKTLADLGLHLVPSLPNGNNCLIDSLISALSRAGLIDSTSQPGFDRISEGRQLREFLQAKPDLYPRTVEGRKDPNAFLEHHLHAEPIVKELLHKYSMSALGYSVQVRVHARYDTDRSPPDLVEFDAHEPFMGLHPGAAITLQLFNWTGDGLDGFHYDALEQL